MSEWQPIDSAPKDGTEILAWDGAGMTVVSWKSFKSGVGYWSLSYCGSYAEDSYFDYPTRWKPLPEPPSE